MMISQTVWLNQLSQNPQVFRAATFLNGTFENLILECAFPSDVFWAHFILEALQQGEQGGMRKEGGRSQVLYIKPGILK